MSTKASPWFLAAVVTAFCAGSAFAQQAPARDPLRFDFNGGFVKFGVEAGTQGVVESRAFWNLARALDPASTYRANQRWGEFYLKPSLNFEARLGSVSTLYGGLSAVGARTQGRDIYDQRNQGRLLLENGYLGIRHGTPGPGFFFDISGGPQPYRIGSGMLISDGSPDGFERGAVIFGPRQAWAMTAIAKAGYGPLSVEGFYLDPSELQSGDTKTRLAGGKIEWSLGPNQFIGVAYGQVLQSTAPYPQAGATRFAAPAIINNARDGLQFINAYARFNPLPEALPGLWIAGDLAIQRNSRINLSAWGARAEIGYAFNNLPWRPTLAYAYQTFSGDKPNTTNMIERFDPLFYDGGQAAWATGTNGSFVFINSNVNAHRLSVALTITQQDFLTLRYAHVRANELFSPIQFGQGTRLAAGAGGPALISGVSKAHLADDLLVEYTRLLSPNAFLTVGAGYSIPGSGLQAAARPQKLDDWLGGFANLVIRY